MKRKKVIIKVFRFEYRSFLKYQLLCGIQNYVLSEIMRFSFTFFLYLNRYGNIYTGVVIIIKILFSIAHLPKQ